MTDNDRYQRGDYAGDAIRWLAAGFGMGLLVGGALGVLLAPKPGRETREKLKVFAGEFQTRAKTLADDLSERAKVAAGEIGERATTTYEKARVAAGEIGERATTTYEKARVSATDIGQKTQAAQAKVKDGMAKVKEAGVKFAEGYKKKKRELAGGKDTEEVAEEE